MRVPDYWLTLGATVRFTAARMAASGRSATFDDQTGAFKLEGREGHGQ